MEPNAPWLAFYGDMPTTLAYPKTTMYGLVADTARQHPHAPAYDFMGRRTTYQQLMNRIQRAASAFADLGVGPGDRVTLCLPNVPQGVDAFYALNALGAVACMVHPLSAPEEIAYYLTLSGSEVIVTLDMFYEKIRSILPKLRHSCRVAVATMGEELPAVKRMIYPLTKVGKTQYDLTGALLWKELVKVNPRPMQLKGSAEDCAAVLYSGGTTGTPKGICLSNRNFNALALQTIAASGCKTIAGTSMLSVMPLFHGFGLGIGIHTALVGGAQCLLVPRFTVDSYAKLIKTKKPNFIPGVPTLFAALLQAKGLKNADLSFLKGVFSGGDSLSPDLKKRVDAFLKERRSPVPIREGYGTTECVTASCLTPTTAEKEGSIGIPYPDIFYKIVAPGTTHQLPPDAEGEICLTGPTVMMGYLDDPEETARVLKTHADGKTWLHTGDLGTMDADGYVYFRQRIKRVIISNGYNIYPTQLEKVLEDHPAIAASCVIGGKDPYRGQKVVAFAVKQGDVTEKELIEYCKNYVARYALPKEIIFKEELPKTLVGKVAYRQLEEEYNAKA